MMRCERFERREGIEEGEVSAIQDIGREGERL
jgi:hypothetical protein